MSDLRFVVYIDGRFIDSVGDQDAAVSIALAGPGTERRIDVHEGESGQRVLNSLHWYAEQGIWVPAGDRIRM